MTEEQVHFEAEGDLCEGVLAHPEAEDPLAAAVFLAPHPLMGGNMDNNVVRHLARRCAEEGLLTLRFNYRGVDGSTLSLPPGTSRHDYFSGLEERREYERLLPETFAAIAHLRQAAPGLEPLLVGYSLGALLAGWMTPETGLLRVVCISPPNTRVSLDAFRNLTIPKVVLGGDRDPFFYPAGFQKDFADWPEPKAFLPFPNADHFFRGEEERLFQTLRPHLIPVRPPA